ncbi:gamma-glutamylcyclotransferase [Pseudomonas umsongensis]|uniref:gamma-glutamylcyclotransferase n=1 Tax=Pseudomonas umsongensis TaxID=198618 RepID=UPI003ECE4A3C
MGTHSQLRPCSANEALLGAISLRISPICNGKAYWLPARDHFKQPGLLMFREIDANPPTNLPRWLSVKTESGILRALAFVAARDGMAYAGRLPMEKIAHVLARAAGHWSSSAQYLFRATKKS